MSNRGRTNQSNPKPRAPFKGGSQNKTSGKTTLETITLKVNQAIKMIVPSELNAAGLRIVIVFGPSGHGEIQLHPHDQLPMGMSGQDLRNLQGSRVALAKVLGERKKLLQQSKKENLIFRISQAFTTELNVENIDKLFESFDLSGPGVPEILFLLNQDKILVENLRKIKKLSKDSYSTQAEQVICELAKRTRKAMWNTIRWIVDDKPVLTAAKSAEFFKLANVPKFFSKKFLSGSLQLEGGSKTATSVLFNSDISKSVTISSEEYAMVEEFPIMKDAYGLQMMFLARDTIESLTKETLTDDQFQTIAEVQVAPTPVDMQKVISSRVSGKNFKYLVPTFKVPGLERIQGMLQFLYSYMEYEPMIKAGGAGSLQTQLIGLKTIEFVAANVAGSPPAVRQALTMLQSGEAIGTDLRLCGISDEELTVRLIQAGATTSRDRKFHTREVSKLLSIFALERRASRIREYLDAMDRLYPLGPAGIPQSDEQKAEEIGEGTVPEPPKMPLRDQLEAALVPLTKEGYMVPKNGICELRDALSKINKDAGKSVFALYEVMTSEKARRSKFDLGAAPDWGGLSSPIIVPPETPFTPDELATLEKLKPSETLIEAARTKEDKKVRRPNLGNMVPKATRQFLKDELGKNTVKLDAVLEVLKGIQNERLQYQLARTLVARFQDNQEMAFLEEEIRKISSFSPRQAEEPDTMSGLGSEVDFDLQGTAPNFNDSEEEEDNVET